jgi:5-methyltetrahydrofolate--homocysteine methyltransferase
MDLKNLISKQSVVLLDGAMGTQLAALGLPMGGQNCLSRPDEVLGIHKQYAAAGCDMLTANTLTMNRIAIDTYSVGVDVKEVNVAGAKLARAAAGKGQYVLGDISATGQMLQPYGDYSEEQLIEAFVEQAGYLAEGGVDGFLVETMLDLREAVCAARACAKVSSSLPVVVTLAFRTVGDGGRTVMGSTAAEAARELTAAGACAVGANCGELDPHEMAGIVAVMKAETSLPVVAQPNAGKPKVVDGETVFDMQPAAFADGIAECVASGAVLVGGCCGTTPEHIRCAADTIRKPNGGSRAVKET